MAQLAMRPDVSLPDFIDLRSLYVRCEMSVIVKISIGLRLSIQGLTNAMHVGLL